MKYKRHYAYQYGVCTSVKFVPSVGVCLCKYQSNRMGEVKISPDNRGYKMLYTMGWNGHSQLGPRKNIPFKDPVLPKRRLRKCKRTWFHGIGMGAWWTYSDLIEN